MEFNYILRKEKSFVMPNYSDLPGIQIIIF